jgi:hypothetical protein
MDLQHKTGKIVDDNGPIIFNWHLERGILAERMSGLELCSFIISHIPNLIPLFDGHPRVQLEMLQIFNKITQMPVNALDEVLPWIQSVTRTGPDDIITLNLSRKEKCFTNEFNFYFYNNWYL